MAFYRVCSECGAHLDPGERCSCIEERQKAQEKEMAKERVLQKLFYAEKNGQLRLAV